MTDRIRAVDCPSCGAPLEIPAEHQRLFQCNFCGTTLEDLTPIQEQEANLKPKVVIHSTTVAPRSVSRPAANTGCSVWVILLLILGFVGAVIIIPLWLSGEIQLGSNLIDQVNRIRIYSFGLTRLLPSDNDTNPDVVGVTSNADETHRMVYIDFEANSHLRWQSEPISDEASYSFNYLVADQTALYLAYETSLVAFDRLDGTILWEIELSDQVSNICQDCLQVFDSYILALTDDGVLTGIEVQTGEPIWSLRLNETPRQLVNLNGKAGVLDEENDKVGINIYASETGTLIQRIVPQCPNDIFPSSPQSLGIYDPILVTDDEQGIYIPISGYDPGCLQRLNPATLEIDWQTQVPGDVLEAMSWNPYLLTDKWLYTSDRNQLFAVSLLEGGYLDVFSDEDYNLIPLAEQNGTLITLAERTRGTRHYFLWGIDVLTQSVSWQFEPQAENIYDDSSDVVYKEGLWGIGVDSGQTVVWQAFSDPGTLSFTVLDPLDGSTQVENSFEVNQNDYSYWMQVPGWDGESVYLMLDANLWLIDTFEGTKIADWP